MTAGAKNIATPAASPVAGVSARIAEIASRLAAYPRGAVTRSWEAAQRRKAFLDAAPEDIRFLLDQLRAQPSAEGDGWIAGMPTAIIHPEVVAVWTKATSPEHQVSASMAVELQMWRAWGEKRPPPAAPVAKEGRES